jgi:L-ascorbate metabolism protein UlaG (beta-lactamase superfamily)
MTANKIHWLDHDSIRIEGEENIYIDPWQLESGRPEADLILITHSHHDHCSRRDTDSISGPRTIIFAPPDCVGCLPAGFRSVAPGMKISVDGIGIEAIAAYNP